MPIFNANCGLHETLTKQIIYYVQSNIGQFGVEIIPLVTNFSAMCCTRLPFEHLEDTMSMLIIAIQSFKKQAIQMVIECFSIMFKKAIAAGIPKSSTSDTEKVLIRVQSHFLRFIATGLEEIGIEFMISNNVCVLNEVVSWIVQHYNEGIEISDKKSCLRHLKAIWVFINPQNTLFEIVLSKKAKQIVLEAKDLSLLNLDTLHV